MKFAGIGTKGADAAAIGDFYMNDGSIVDKDSTLTSAQQAACIGIVFSVADKDTPANDRVDYATKAALTAKGTEYHGLVMALTNASNGCRWGDYGKDETGLANVTTLAAQWANVSGYPNTQWIIDAYSGSGTTLQDTHTAFYSAQQYGKTDATKKYAAPAATTGWFIPSMGQWWSIIENLGGVSLDAYKAGTDSYKHIDDAATTAVAGLNAPLGSVTGAEQFSTSTSFCSCSEFSDAYACRILFGYNWIDIDTYGKGDAGFHVRCILAF